MKKGWLIGLIVLVSCQTNSMYEPEWEELKFEWIEPAIFQQDWIRCRSQPVCTADMLFS